MEPQDVVVVGASLAGLRAVETARREGYRGRLTLVGDERHLPYDRPPLSKEYLDADVAADPPHFPSVAGLATELDVEVRLGQVAEGLDPGGRTVVVDGKPLPYEALVITTGASARTLPGCGHLQGVHALRTLDDALAIRAALDAGARTVVVGAGFIGSEIASAARKRGLTATVLEALPTPLVRAVGESAGAALSALHLRHGTDLRCEAAVERLLGVDRVTGVQLTDGSTIEADLVVVGIGAAPSTTWLHDSGLVIDDGVVCDATLRAAPGVWAAGDVARWMSPDFDRLLRLEHWTNAAEQGAQAMRNALAPQAATPYHHIPYFWSDWYGHRIQFAGVPNGEPVVVTGSWEGDAFAALYGDGQRFLGVLTLNRRADIMKYRALIARRATMDEAIAFAGTRRPAVA